MSQDAIGLKSEGVSSGDNGQAPTFKEHLLGVVGPKQTAVEVHLNVKGITLPVDLAEPLSIVLHELLCNSLKHGFVSQRAGMIGVSMEVGPQVGWLVVHDDGVGLPRGFDPDNSAGLGLRIAGQFAAQAGGKIGVAD